LALDNNLAGRETRKYIFSSRSRSPLLPTALFARDRQRVDESISLLCVPNFDVVGIAKPSTTNFDQAQPLQLACHGSLMHDKSLLPARG
jgi:hypothetical protein